MGVRYDIKKLSESINILLKESESVEQLTSVGGQTASIAQKLKEESIRSKEIVQEITEKLCKSDELNGEEKWELEEEIRNLKEKVTKLEEKIRTLYKNEADNQKRVARLEDDLLRKDGQITTLNEKVERHETKLKEMESALRTGQIAFEFEKDLARYIYPHDKKFGSRKIFTNMKRWLEDKKDTQQGREANEKWDALKEEFSWSSEHERVFFKLLEFRREFAHPALDQNVAQFQIPDDFTDEEKNCIKVINDMIQRVNILMQ